MLNCPSSFFLLHFVCFFFRKNVSEGEGLCCCSSRSLKKKLEEEEEEEEVTEGFRSDGRRDDDHRLQTCEGKEVLRV